MRKSFLSIAVLAFTQCAAAQDQAPPSIENLRPLLPGMKAQMKQRYDELTRKAIREKQLEKGGRVASDCGYLSGLDFTPPAVGPDATVALPVWARAMFMTAQAIEEASNVMRDVPPAVWQKALAAFEERQIAAAWKVGRMTFKDEAQVQMALEPFWNEPKEVIDSINAYRRSKGLAALDEKYYRDGCGAGDYLLRIETTPPASQLRLMPEFFARLCEKTGKGLAGSDCPYWFNVSPSARVAVSGVYRYHAVWPDGQSGTGRIDFDKSAHISTLEAIVIPKGAR